MRAFQTRRRSPGVWADTVPMRSICVVTQQYSSVVSGIGLHARNLVTGLRREGHRVTVLTQITQRSDSALDEVEVLTVPEASMQSTQARWVSLARSFSRELRRQGAAERFDVVHFTDARESLLFGGRHPAVVGNVNDYYAAQVRSPRYYRRWYADYWKRWPYYLFVHACERIGFRRLGAVIANSEYTRDVVQQAYGLDGRRLFKCFKCIDLSSFDDQQSSRRSDGLVLFVGGNMQRKGLEVLVRAAPLVLAARPDVRFQVVGSDDNVPRMRALCSALGVEDRFQFTGWMPNEELQRLYRMATVFVMPSLMEAFGVSFLESMASGTPVVGTQVGGVPELIQHGVNGLLVEVGSPIPLAEAVVAILTDPALAERLGRNGRRTAARFGVQQMLSCTCSVYEQLLGEPL
jgi:glycosyltransferase involved in cell wall biosynthesis